MARIIRYFQFPKLNLENQDKTSTYGTHWEEIKNCNEKLKCVLIAEDLDSLYYIPINQPYVLGKKDNFFPRQESGSYITHNGYTEAFEMQNFLPDNVFIPYKEFIEQIPPENWFNAYIELIKSDPQLIHTMSNFGFWLSDKICKQGFDKRIERYVYKCYPFQSICQVNGKIKYVYHAGFKNSISRYKYRNYNVDELNTDYHNIEDGTILPILRIERKTKKKKKI